MNESLIYGKDQTQCIVSLEVNDNQIELFVQKENGEVESEFRPNKFWLLSSQKLNKNFVKLDGNLHYCYGTQFSTRDDYMKARNVYKSQDLFSIYDPKESAMVKDGYTYFKGLHPKDVSILAFDIETTGLVHDETSKVLIISNTLRKNGQVTRKLFTYDEYETEALMILAWSTWVMQNDPSIICGHNILGYDLPYLKFIADRAGVNIFLGRDQSPLQFDDRYESRFRVDGSRDLSYHKVKCYGREIIDTMFLAIRYDVATKKYESYGLKSIIKYENLEVKDRVFYDASNIRNVYTDPTEWEKIKQYALHDADDALALFDLMSPSYFYMTQSIPKPFQTVTESATGAQINSMMIRSYIQNKHSIPKPNPKEEYEGAISFGNPGVYHNVQKVDVASLYPSIMIQYEVYDKEKDPKANFSNLVQTFTKSRLEYKKKFKETGESYYQSMDAAAKIFINSCYGFLGTPGLCFNSPKNAAFITETGREILQHSIDWAHRNNLTVVNADTDSISFCKSKMEPISEEEQKNYLDDLNSEFPERIKFEADGYFPSFIVLKAKNYILYDGKKIKTKGSSLKSSTIEPALKSFLNEIIEAMVFQKGNYQDIYNRYVKEVNNIKDIKRWASKKTISEKTLKSERTNESKIRDAIEGEEFVEGDKIYCYFKSDGSLGLAEKFDGDYDKMKLLEKLYKTTERFSTVLGEDVFINYKLKRNQKVLEQLLQG